MLLLSTTNADSVCQLSRNQAIFAAACITGGFVTAYFLGRISSRVDQRCNRMIDLDNKKVKHVIDVEDITEKREYCRCWKSKTFPLCDGAHKEHNKLSGDNTGPLVILCKRGKKKTAQN